MVCRREHSEKERDTRAWNGMEHSASWAWKTVCHGHLTSVSPEHASFRFLFPQFHSNCSTQQWPPYCTDQDFCVTSLNLSLAFKLLIRPQSLIIKAVQSHVISVHVVVRPGQGAEVQGAWSRCLKDSQSQNSPPTTPLGRGGAALGLHMASSEGGGAVSREGVTKLGSVWH